MASVDWVNNVIINMRETIKRERERVKEREGERERSKWKHQLSVREDRGKSSSPNFASLKKFFSNTVTTRREGGEKRDEEKEEKEEKEGEVELQSSGIEQHRFIQHTQHNTHTMKEITRFSAIETDSV